MTPKLTPTQLSVIKRMKEGETLIATNTEHRFWLISRDNHFINPVNDERVLQLLKMGLIDDEGVSIFPTRRYYTLTQKGREIEA